MRHLVLPQLSDRTLGSLLPADMQAWVAGLGASGYAPTTVRKAYQLATGVLTAAVESGLIPRTPCRGIPLPRFDAQEMRFLHPDEIQHLADTVDPHYRALILSVAYTGLRWGEAAALPPRRPQPARPDPHRHPHPRRSPRPPRGRPKPQDPRRPAHPDLPASIPPN